MTALATPTELERLARERDEFVAWLAHQFPEALSFEDVEDLVAEALPALAGDPQLPGSGRRRRNYIRRALWRDALDELRHRHGRDLQDGARELVPLGDIQTPDIDLSNLDDLEGTLELLRDTGIL